MTPVRLTIVQTHPVQYNAPWFRHIAANCPEIDLTVVYAARPRPTQQGTGFDVAVRVGHAAVRRLRLAPRAREPPTATTSHAARFRGLDVPEIGAAIADTPPDVVLVPGWHSVTLVRALAVGAAPRHSGLYRGDTHNETAPPAGGAPLWHVKTRAFLSLLFRATSRSGAGRASTSTAHGAAAHAHLRVAARGRQRRRSPRRSAASARRPRGGARRAAAGGPDDFVVLFAGKIEARKRPLDAVRAVAVARPERRARHRADAATLDRRCAARSRRLGVRVAWLGFVNQSRDRRASTRRRTASCCRASDESWGLVVNEAMATGLPAVVSDRVGCAPDLDRRPAKRARSFGTGDVDDLRGALGACAIAAARASMATACRAPDRPPQLRRGHHGSCGRVPVAGRAARRRRASSPAAAAWWSCPASSA